MADGIQFDFSEFFKLMDDFQAVAKESPRKARQVMQQTGMRTKKEWAGIASGNPFGRQYTATIDYTLDGSAQGGTFGVEIGPNIARYGGKTGKGGTVPSAGIFDDPLSAGGVMTGPDRARRKAEKFMDEDFVKGIGIALDQLLKGRNL